MTWLFQSILITSAVGTLLAGLLMLARVVTRRIFSSGWHYYMWLCVLLVMMLPVSFRLPEATLSQKSYTTQSTVAEAQVQNTAGNVISVSYSLPDNEEESMPVIPQNFMHILSIVWLAGAGVFFLIKLASYGFFLKKLFKYSVPTQCPELLKYTKRRIGVRVSNKICSPLILGVIKPVLLLPDIPMEEAQHKNILAHEMTHLRRGDILYKWLVTLVKCIHWFNPAIYLISRQIDADCEISCDISAVRDMSEQEKMSYVETILALLSRNGAKYAPLTTGMTGNKRLLKKRFATIKANRRFGKKAMVISLISAVVVLACAVFAGGFLNGRYIHNAGTDKASGSDFNLLFVGLDKGRRADTIMLIKCRESSINGISIPRDTLIGDKRIREVWASGGISAVVDAVRDTLDVPVNYYLTMNLDAIPKLIDAIGETDFYVPMDMEYSDPYQDLDIKLKEGYFSLTGDGVKQLLQFRPGNSTHGDLSRIYIHQQFLKSFLKQHLNQENLGRAKEILRLVSADVETNYPMGDLKKNTALVTAVMNNNVVFETADGVCETYNDMPVYELSSEISFVWPTESTQISNGFGKRVHPITGEEKIHNGVDIIAEEGSAVYSAISGTVTDVGYDKEFGNFVVIEYPDGVSTFYGHLKEIFVKKGDNVSQKDLIASAGRTGTATGTNLHFEVKLQGEYYDPEKLLKSYTGYHENLDLSLPTSVINGFFRAFEAGDYNKMKEYCTYSCYRMHFLENDYGDVFSVFGMSMAKLRSMSEPLKLKGVNLLSYTVNVSCKTPKSFSILQNKNTFRVFLEKQSDGTYLIYDISY